MRALGCRVLMSGSGRSEPGWKRREHAAQLREPSSSSASMSGGLAPVDMSILTVTNVATLGTENTVDDVADLAYRPTG